ILALLFAHVLALASGCAAAANVGRVILSAGDATALRQGQVIRLGLGTRVQDQDVLRTGPASNLQVRFEDDSYVSLREGSELRVDQYRYSGGKDADESAVFSLIKGGLRAVTGLIGRRNHDNYRLSTPTATIGIRGTDYAATLCQGDCRNPDGSKAEDGLYGRVIGQSNGTNQVTVANKSGPPTTLGINSNFYIKDINSSVQLLLLSPDFVLSKLEGRGRSAGAGSSGGSGSEQASSGGASDESRPSTIPAPLPPLQFVVTQDLGPQGTPTVVSTLPSPSGFAVAFPGGPTSFGNAFLDNDFITGTYNSLNQLTSFQFPGIPAGSLGGGSIVDTGSLTASNGDVFVYGRWNGAAAVPLYDGSTFVAAPNVPLLFVTASGVANDSVVGILGGVATYTYADGPKPVDFGGNVGSITSTSTTINFTTLQQQLSLAMNFPSVLVSGTNMGPAAFNLNSVNNYGFISAQLVCVANGGCGDLFGQLSGTCTGGGCVSPSASGFFGTGLGGAKSYEIAVVTGLVDGTKAGEVAFLNLYTLNAFTPGPAPSSTTGQIAYANLSPSVPGGTFTLSSNLTQFDVNGNPTSFTSPNSSLFGSLANGAIMESGSTLLADGGTMSWGRWSASAIVNDPVVGIVNPSTGVPFVVGQEATLPTSGTFLYSYAGGPNPVNVNGAVGTFGGGAFNVSFGASSGSLSVATPLTMSVAGVNYSLASCTGGCSFTNNSPVAGNMVLTGTCTNGACTTGAAATANTAGVFVGPQGAGLAVAGNVFSPAPTVAFGAGFKR
ncbi:MAG: FecR family protein, partial [Burkholderiales bacterium]